MGDSGGIGDAAQGGSGAPKRRRVRAAGVGASTGSAAGVLPVFYHSKTLLPMSAAAAAKIGTDCADSDSIDDDTWERDKRAMLDEFTDIPPVELDFMGLWSVHLHNRRGLVRTPHDGPVCARACACVCVCVV